MPRQSRASQPSSSSAGGPREPRGSQLNPSSSQASQSAPTVDGELDQLVVNMVKVILNLSVNKYPIKKTDLAKNALGGNSRAFPKVIGPAMTELSEVYGYKLIETERNKTFILVSNLPCGSILDLNEDYRRKYTLLYLVLGYIFMKNGNVPEQGLWDFLAKLNINDEEEHTYFGNVRKLVGETFAKQAYIVRTKQVVEGMNEDRFLYSWGVRAHHELSQKDILESICKLLGKPSICYVTQHTAAYGESRDDGEDDESMDASQA
ncbi:non-structural maintenance of chromosomes element 3 homolog [Topomyia yanbarensis]|uniref:non-structural maintenance of chromosomes element 3 homolog n=1 Tax=Topomyia yanbarensis TaxID=2498891 RepID=UPI00273C6648|nr:non-structural maintenance of chromosomes element 3 homolog [Topomyia yanbarensis]